MELRQIRYFLALSETLNFTRAAEMTNVTQPTLTLAIKKLEEELGGPLVHRERNRTHLTNLGQMLLPFLQQVYESSQAAQAVARELKSGSRSPLSIGVSDLLDKKHLISPIREVQQATNGLELHVEGGTEQSLFSRLDAGDLDMAIIDAAAVAEERFRVSPMYTEEIKVLLPQDHPLSAQPALAMTDLADRDWVELIGSRVHADFDAAATAAIEGWRVQHRASRSTEAQVLVSCGLGLALAGGHEPLLPGLSLTPLTEPLLTRTIGIAEVRGRRSSTAALALARLLRAQTYAPPSKRSAA